jgi:hypothetical protein
MGKQNRVPKVRYFVPEFVKALRKQLIDDDKRWGTAWLEGTLEGQEDRMFQRISEYYNEFKSSGASMPWLKVVGLALIAWIREQHPELFPTLKEDTEPIRNYWHVGNYTDAKPIEDPGELFTSEPE